MYNLTHDAETEGIDAELDFKQAEYGKRIVATRSTQSAEHCGKVFVTRNLRRMAQFANEFSDIEIVSV
jgi:hypothetical protein